jgi:hypothetical protein
LVTECPVAGVRRDYEQRKGISEPLETLGESVRAFHTAATQLVDEARTGIAQVGSVQEIGMRLTWIEAAMGGRVER